MIKGAGILLFASVMLLLLVIPFSGETSQLDTPDSKGQLVRIGVLARRGSEECLQRWGPTANYLDRKIKDFHFQVVPLTFEEVVTRVQAKDVDFVIVNSSIYVELQALFGVARIATMKDPAVDHDSTVFAGVIFTRADRLDIGSIDDLKGKSFMGVDETSLGGWRAAWRELKAKRIDPYKDFSELLFSGTHDAVIYAVRNGKVDAGTVATPILEQMTTEGKIEPGLFKVINAQEHADFPYVHSTRLYPNWPFAKLKHTPNVLAEKIVIALLAMPRDSPSARAAGVGGWTVPLDYGAVDECLLELRIGNYKDFGKITAVDVLRNYKWQIAAALLAITGLTSLLLLTLRFNHDLRKSKLALQNQISQRENAEAVLKRIRERYELILLSAAEGILGINLEGKVTFANPAAGEMLRYEEEELIGKDLHQVIHHSFPDGTHYPASECPMWLCIRSGVSYRVHDEALWKKDGTSFPTAYSSTPMMENGQVVGAVVTFRDISVRRRAEDALRRSQRQLADIIDFLPDATFVINNEGTVIAWNRAIEEMTGISKDKMIGKGDFEYSIPFFGSGRPILIDLLFASEEKKTDYYDSVATVGSGIVSECYAPGTYGGKGAYIWGVANALFDEQGNLAGAIESIRDITQRKLAEESLRDSEIRLRAITDSARDAILMMDPEGMITYWNPAAERILGYTRQEASGQNLHKLLAPQRYHATHKAAFPKFVETGQGEATGKTLELVARRKDGEEIPVELSLSAIFMNGWHAVGLLRDITERKQAEEKLRENQSRLDLALRSAHMGVWHIDLIENKRHFDDQVCHLLGIDPAKFTGTAEEFYKAVHPNDRKMLAAALARSIEQDALYEKEYRVVWPNGSVRYIITRGKLFRDEKGRPVRMNGLVWDITERKQAEDALKESQQRLSDIIDFLPDATFVIDREGKVIAWNLAMQEMTGISATAMLGKGDYEYALPLYGERIPILIDLVLDPKKEREAKYLTLERKEGVLAAHAYMPDLRGRQAYLFGTASALYDSRGNVVGAIESMRDITERRLMEEAVAKAEEKYRNIFENSVTGIYQTNLEGDFLNVNAALARFGGYDSPEEMLNEAKNVRQLYVHPERRYEMLRLIEEYGSVREFEAEFFRKDKSIVWVTLNIRAVLNSTGGSAYLEGTASDITDRKLLSARLAHAQKLEAIGTLAGGIAHDFNNMLQPMMGYTEMALNKLSSSSLLRHDLEQVLNASLRAKELVGQILTISRSAQEQQRIPIDIGSIIKEALKLLRCSLPTSIEIRQNIQIGFALADPTQIHQVLMNLCTNAAHAMDNKGIMEVCLAPVDFSESDLVDQSIVDLEPGPYLKLCVSDTGCGMGSKTMERIFDPYFTTKEVGKGSGLGLAVVHGIVKRHEGAITVRSEPGKGTTFSVYTPRVDIQAEAKMQVDDPLQLGTEKILLVDDESAVMEMGTRLLEHLGYKVTSQTDSLKALEIFRSSPDEFDLIITDYTMPKLTGLDFAKEVRRIHPDMPVMLCTGYSEKVTPDSMKELAVRLLMKPYGMRQISEEVRKILDAKKQ